MKKVLLVEDCERQARGFKRKMKSFEVDIAPTSQDAEKLLEENNYDFALLDIMLNNSEKQGHELLPWIRIYYPDVIPVMISALTDLAVAQHCYDNGATTYISKDASEEEINAALHEALSPKKRLYKFFSSTNNHGDCINPDKAQEEGRTIATYISQFIPDDIGIPSLSSLDVYEIFFNPLTKINPDLFRGDSNVPSKSLEHRYTPGGNKDNILLFGDGPILSDLKESLPDNVFTATTLNEVEDRIFHDDICCVMILLPPEKSLYYLRRIKLIDPRIEVGIYHHGLTSFEDGITLLDNGAYNVCSNQLKIIDTINSMKEKANINFQDTKTYFNCRIAKEMWVQGFSFTFGKCVRQRADILKVNLDYTELDKLNIIQQALIPELFGEYTRA